MIIVVPARGGSKRVPGKNIRSLAGRPLLAYTLFAAKESGVKALLVVSTEDPEVAGVAENLGVRTIDRPQPLARDDSSTESVLIHALEALTAEATIPEWVMVLPPTSPFRKAATIRRFAEEIHQRPDAQDCLMSITEDRGDYWLKEEDGTLRRLFPDAPRRQQDRVPIYEENSAIYVARSEVLLATQSIMGSKVRGLAIDPIEAFDINTEQDFIVAEALACELPELLPNDNQA